MFVLSIDTAAATSTALVRFGAAGTAEVLAEYNGVDTRSHAEELAPQIRYVLEAAQVKGRDIGAVVAGTGPGPFTGLRVGIMAARSIAFAWAKPLYGVMSLHALAYDVAVCHPDAADFIVVTDARRQEVYWARYRLAPASRAELVEGPRVSYPGDIPYGGISAYGQGTVLYPDSFGTVLAPGDGAPLYPTAGSLARAAALEKEAGALGRSTEPLYLRPSDARAKQSFSAVRQ